MKKEKKLDGETNRRSSKSASGLLLMLVQSSVTIIVLVLVLLLKMINTDVFSEVETLFKNAVMNTTMPTEELKHTAVHKELTTQTTVKTIAKDAVAVSAPVFDAKPTFYPPLKNGVITSRYGVRNDPIDGTAEAVHEGVDIAAVEGTPLAALTSGRVTEVGYEENGYGHYVIVLSDDSYSYLYAHCSKIDVKTGDAVQSGETLAYVGNTGRSTGSHVHIEWREHDKPLDPMTVLPEETYA